ncbi:MAG: PLP-dependent aminotransferase family protein [Cellulosilyticaceae bacterium]
MNFVSIQLDPSSKEPLYMQLFTILKEAILNGTLNAEDRLPAIRTLAKDLSVNTVTIINAYSQLELSHYVTSKKGSGFYVNKLSKNTPSLMPLSSSILNNNLINFSSASPAPEIFPTDSFKECLNNVIDRDKGFAFGYQESNGFAPLREMLCTFLEHSHSIHTKPNLIQVVSGAQQGLDIIAKSCLNAGDYVITETPTYSGATDVFASRGSRMVTVSLTDNGINLIELEKKIKICKPKLLYVMTTFHNPTTICYSKDSLMQLLILAEKYDFYIIEEDSVSEINYTRTVPQQSQLTEVDYTRTVPQQSQLSLKGMDEGDRVIYSKSFSKLLMPGLRIGFLVIPEKLLERFTQVKEMTDIASSGLIHRSLDLFFRTHKWEQHLSYMHAIYNTKYELMKTKLLSLRSYGLQYVEPNGGLWFWIKLPSNILATKLCELALQKGLLILPSTHFYPLTHKDYERYIRLSFASCTPSEISSGIEILEDCLKSFYRLEK